MYVIPRKHALRPCVQEILIGLGSVKTRQVCRSPQYIQEKLLENQRREPGSHFRREQRSIAETNFRALLIQEITKQQMVYPMTPQTT
jgi:hypothetical protein